MSDGSDGAGGVGNSGGGADSGASASDAVGNAEALGQAVESLSEAISAALGSVADALGLDAAIGQIADALGLDAQSLQGILGAAVVGALTGGVPGAIAAVANALTGNTLAEAARSAVADNLPEAFQPFANIAIDKFTSGIPGANVSLAGALSELASGALTNGRAPDIGDLGAVARSLGDLQSAASGLVGAATSGNFGNAADAVAALESSLSRGMSQANGIASGVASAFGQGHGVYAEGGHGAFGDAVERVAVDTARLLGNR